MIWFTADHHFGHANIIKYCKRPFDSVEEMDAVMIERWNEKIKPGDKVYHLGDFTLLGWDYARNILPQLCGDIWLVPGGHDLRWKNEYKKVLPPLYNIRLDVGEKHRLVIVLCHYAMRVWDRSHYGSLHLYGHSHGNLPGTETSMDVGVDTNNFYPYSLDEILERLT